MMLRIDRSKCMVIHYHLCNSMCFWEWRCSICCSCHFLCCLCFSIFDLRYRVSSRWATPIFIWFESQNTILSSLKLHVVWLRTGQRSRLNLPLGGEGKGKGSVAYSVSDWCQITKLEKMKTMIWKFEKVHNMNKKCSYIMNISYDLFYEPLKSWI